MFCFIFKSEKPDGPCKSLNFWTDEVFYLVNVRFSLIEKIKSFTFNNIKTTSIFYKILKVLFCNGLMIFYFSVRSHLN